MKGCCLETFVSSEKFSFFFFLLLSGLKCGVVYEAGVFMALPRKGKAYLSTLVQLFME